MLGVLTEVGWAEVTSAIPRPTKKVKKATMIQPTDMTPGPPVVSPYSNSVVIPVITLWTYISIFIYAAFPDLKPVRLQYPADSQ